MIIPHPLHILTAGVRSCLCAIALVGTVDAQIFVHDETVSGDLSNNFELPHVMNLPEGSSYLRLRISSSDVDLFTLHLREFQQLDSIIVRDYGSSGANISFLGFQEGEKLSEAPAENFEGAIDYVIFGAWAVNEDILPLMVQNNARLSPPLRNRSLAFWANETGPASSFVLEFQTSTYPPKESLSAVPDEAFVDEDSAVVIEVTDNDVGSSSSDIYVTEIVSQPEFGEAVIARGAVQYKPKDDFNGTDMFNYRIRNGHGETATAIVNITVRPVNDDPVSIDDKSSGPEGGDLMIDALANDSDKDGDALTITGIPSQGEHGSASVKNGALIYSPKPGFNGEDAFTYEISDGNGGKATARVTVTIEAAPLPSLRIIRIARLTDGQFAAELAVDLSGPWKFEVWQTTQLQEHFWTAVEGVSAASVDGIVWTIAWSIESPPPEAYFRIRVVRR
jgi:hypothetical protein